MKYVKIFFLLFGIFMIVSCSSITKKEIIIETELQKKDRLEVEIIQDEKEKKSKYENIIHKEELKIKENAELLEKQRLIEKDQIWEKEYNRYLKEEDIRKKNNIKNISK